MLIRGLLWIRGQARGILWKGYRITIINKPLLVNHQRKQKDVATQKMHQN